MWHRVLPFPLLLSLLSAGQQAQTSTDVPTDFRIRYVNGSNVYINGGRSAGLAEGMVLVVKQSVQSTAADSTNRPIEPGIIAQLRVVAVASASAVCEVTSTSRPLVEGDVVSLPQKEAEQMAEKKMLGNTRAYPMTVSFTGGDPLDEEVRAEMPRPPLPEVNEARGRFGFDISTIRALGQSSAASTVYGIVARADITRIRGSHWNLNGYYRGQIESASMPSQPTIQDLINRTYVMEMTYVNPDSSWTAGVGRLYLPWATSLEVIDGGYLARNLSPGTLTGIFAGSTPDPTAWDYDPNRRIGGMFFNAHGGDYATFRYSDTVGVGVDLNKWKIDRPFVFTENDVSWKRFLSVYESMQFDKPTANPSAPPVAAGVGQSFLSVQAHLTPHATLELNDTDLRDVPTYDPALLGTGLLDQYLFQGLTGGARVDLPLQRFGVPAHVTVYFSGGQSSTSTDSGKSWNLQGGATLSHIPYTRGVQIDARYSNFNSEFAVGNYRTITIARTIADRFQLNLQGGRQAFTSTLATSDNSWFGNAYVDTNIGPMFFLETGFTTQRGGSDDYNQWTMAFGYRFDNRAAKRRLAGGR